MKGFETVDQSKNTWCHLGIKNLTWNENKHKIILCTIVLLQLLLIFWMALRISLSYLAEKWGQNFAILYLPSGETFCYLSAKKALLVLKTMTSNFSPRLLAQLWIRNNLKSYNAQIDTHMGTHTHTHTQTHSQYKRYISTSTQGLIKYRNDVGTFLLYYNIEQQFFSFACYSF